MYFNYIPFAPSNYDYLDTSNNEHFYVKKIIDGSQEFTLYKNSAEMNRVDKSEYLELVGTVSGVFRDEASITNFSITIEYDTFIDFNYVYISTFNRYYYVTDITLINYNLYEITLSVDVLMTYKNGIYNSQAFIERNEYKTNPLIYDNLLPLELGEEIEYDYITNELFTDQSGEYVLQGLLVSYNPIE